jgi:hypothetical protein
MSNVFYMSPNDTLWALDFYLDDTEIDLTGASVTFTLRTEAGALLFTRPALVLIATGTPALRYVWQTADMAAEGDFKAWFRVTWPFGTKTFPTPGSIPIVCRQ